MSISEMFGNIERAIIEIDDRRNGQEMQELPAVNGAKGQGAGGAGPKMAPKPPQKNPYIKRFHVQFNPNDLSLSGYSGGLVQKIDYNKEKGGVSFDSVDVNINLSVRLIFDQVTAQNAFFEGKFTPSITMNIKGIKDALSGTDKGTKVQTQVEGFIAALRNKYTRKVTFNWGKLSYTGTLKNVNAQYVMFNVQGEPVRAYVVIGMILVDGDTQKKDPLTASTWKARYKKSFSKSESLNNWT